MVWSCCLKCLLEDKGLWGKSNMFPITLSSHEAQHTSARQLQFCICRTAGQQTFRRHISPLSSGWTSNQQIAKHSVTVGRCVHQHISSIHIITCRNCLSVLSNVQMRCSFPPSSTHYFPLLWDSVVPHLWAWPVRAACLRHSAAPWRPTPLCLVSRVPIAVRNTSHQPPATSSAPLVCVSSGSHTRVSSVNRTFCFLYHHVKCVHSPNWRLLSDGVTTTFKKCSVL